MPGGDVGDFVAQDDGQIMPVCAWVDGQYGISDLLSLTLAAIQNGYSRSLENQADRVGLEYMASAGYDPRQAPEVWKSMTKALGDHPTNLFWSNHDNNSTRRSYLMSELRNNYSDFDYRAVKTNPEAFAEVRARVLAESRSGAKLRIVESQGSHAASDAVSRTEPTGPESSDASPRAGPPIRYHWPR